jgi:hypothetical protein
MSFGRRIIGGRAVVVGRLNSAVTAAFLALCCASGSNAEPDAEIEHAPPPVQAAQDLNTTVVPDRNANGSTAQTVNDAAKNLPSVSIAPNTSCDTLVSAAATHGIPPEFFARLIRQESNFDPNSVSRAGAHSSSTESASRELAARLITRLLPFNEIDRYTLIQHSG